MKTLIKAILCGDTRPSRDGTGENWQYGSRGLGLALHLYITSSGGKKRKKLLEGAFPLGITHFDTSPYYGFGLAESDLDFLMLPRSTSIFLGVLLS